MATLITYNTKHLGIAHKSLPYFKSDYYATWDRYFQDKSLMPLIKWLEENVGRVYKPVYGEALKGAGWRLEYDTTTDEAQVRFVTRIKKAILIEFALRFS